MTLISTISDLLDDPQGVIGRTSRRELGWAGMSGYGLGIFSLFIFLRLFSAVPPGAYSYASLLLLGLGVNFCFAAGIHLFLEMTGAEGDALKLFFLFGLTELFMMLLIPLGFLARLDYLNPVADFFLCFAVIIAARVSIIRRLYSISRNKALLSAAMPYAAVFSGFFMLLVYAIVYLVWLVV
ncbi:MAG: hypothetical protein WCW52_09755 [Elusimicrobiales bacterium]|jgi:hypothetical protein